MAKNDETQYKLKMTSTTNSKTSIDIYRYYAGLQTYQQLDTYIYFGFISKQHICSTFFMRMTVVIHSAISVMSYHIYFRLVHIIFLAICHYLNTIGLQKRNNTYFN